jgi:ParB-like chromosome segregation protein Spo0J
MITTSAAIDAASPAADQAADTRPLPFHPLANLLPPMGDDEFHELVTDIGKNGLLTPIALYEGQILDGRNRYRACLEAGIKPEFVTYKGSDPPAFVVSTNIHRRHLTADQRSELIENLLRADPARSNVEISRLAKSSDKTVASKRAKLEGTSEIPRLTKTIGADGKARPARRTSVKSRVSMTNRDSARSAEDALSAAALAWRDATLPDQTRFVSNVGLDNLFQAAPSDQREAFLRHHQIDLREPQPVASRTVPPLIGNDPGEIPAVLRRVPEVFVLDDVAEGAAASLVRNESTGR